MAYSIIGRLIVSYVVISVSLFCPQCGVKTVERKPTRGAAVVLLRGRKLPHHSLVETGLDAEPVDPASAELCRTGRPVLPPTVVLVPRPKRSTAKEIQLIINHPILSHYHPTVIYYPTSRHRLSSTSSYHTSGHYFFT